MNSQINDVTQRIIERSRATRQAYLAKIDKARRQGPHRGVLSCGNLAHGFAACNQEEKSDLRSMTKANIAIVSSYNDMLSAHQPYETYPQIIKDAVKEVGSVAQFAGGVPAMCDGVTQGNPGMELSLTQFATLHLLIAAAPPASAMSPNPSRWSAPTVSEFIASAGLRRPRVPFDALRAAKRPICRWASVALTYAA